MSLKELLKELMPNHTTVQEGHDMVEVLMVDGDIDTFKILRDHKALQFSQLSDVTAVDYSKFGEAEWSVNDGCSSYSRARTHQASDAHHDQRFEVVYHLLSHHYHHRLRVRIAIAEETPLTSVAAVWPSANWFEREVFDLFGIVFNGHPDLTRILTDYGFVGHPFRKDFPLIGHVEMRYDGEQGRCVYEPVSIKPRVGMPRTIRKEGAYHREIKD